MHIHSAKFVRGITKGKELPYENFPHFAVIGRSNVGKSSFINNFTGKKELAYSGSRPGVTQQINLFLLNNKIYLGDLPGYGYAQLSYKQRIELEDLIFWYLNPQNNTDIVFKKVFQLIDAKVGPTQLDLAMRDFLVSQPYETVIIANKVDKIKANQLARSLKNIENCFKGLKIIPYSSKTGEGKKEVLAEFI